MKKALKIGSVLGAALLAAALLSACGAGEAGPTPEPEPEILPQVEISEVMASNKATLDDGSGLFPDWLELYNAGTETADLAGYSLVCSGDRWEIPELHIEPGAYALIFCSESGGAGLRAPFALSSKGEELSLESPGGQTVDSFAVPASQGDESFVRDGAGEIGTAVYTTPGYPNSREGYESFQAARACQSPLQINEVMVYNEWFPWNDGGCYDWVELKNCSGETLNLSGWSLGDKSGDRYALSGSLGAGELLLIPCAGGEGPGAPFALNALEERLYLFDGSGLRDYARLKDLPYGGSCGRMDGENGFFYFASPTPGSGNGGGARLVAEKPELLGSDGVFDGVESVPVELRADGDIYYTLDGSDPGPWSTLYTGPFSLTKTTVLRAVTVREGALQSESRDLSFIINEGHTLPVLSLVTDPSNLFGDGGIYSNPVEKWEKLGSLAFFEEDESFHIGCGVKLHGATSRINQEKKSFKIHFRSRYDGELDYDLFENGVTQFASILLRAAQESLYSTFMRDNLMHQLAIEAFPELPAQDYKYAVLYLNGQYWGIYNIREAHSPTHYAMHYGYDPEAVFQWQGGMTGDAPAEVRGEVREIYDLVMAQNIRDETNYEAAARRLNIDSIIGWTIIQAYSSNYDINSPNMRFYYTPEDGKLSYALVDLDLDMFTNEGFVRPFYFGYDYNDVAGRLIGNAQYREQFLQALSDALNGPLSDEAVEERIDALAEELRPEVERNGKRWGGSLQTWERMLDDLKVWLHGFGGRAKVLVSDLNSYVQMSSEEKQRYFGDVLAK